MQGLRESYLEVQESDLNLEGRDWKKEGIPGRRSNLGKYMHNATTQSPQKIQNDVVLCQQAV